MTSRQRLLAALNHEEPDRVPIDMGGFQTGIHRIAYAELLEYLGIQDEIRILDPVQQLAQPCDDQNLFMDISHHPLSSASIAELDAYCFPRGSDPSRFSDLRRQALRIREDSSHAICTGIGGVV